MRGFDPRHTLIAVATRVHRALDAVFRDVGRRSLTRPCVAFPRALTTEHVGAGSDAAADILGRSSVAERLTVDQMREGSNPSAPATLESGQVPAALGHPPVKGTCASLAGALEIGPHLRREPQ